MSIITTFVIVAVVGFVVHHQLFIYKVEGIRFGLKWVCNHLSDSFGVQFWEVVDVLHAILTVRDTKTKVKIKGFQHFVTEKMTLNHPKLFNGLTSNTEIHGSTDLAQPEMVFLN
jgi:hypothetical protein